MLHAVDVLKEQLVDVGDQALDLLGIHPAVVVDDVKLRLVERREDVFLHPDDAVGPAQSQGEHQHHHGNGSAECEDNRVHRSLSAQSLYAHHPNLRPALLAGGARTRQPSKELYQHDTHFGKSAPGHFPAVPPDRRRAITAVGRRVPVPRPRAERLATEPAVVRGPPGT